MKWRKACTPKIEGGLGLRLLRLMNNALLGKWLWRIGDDTNSLWKQIIVAKYGVKRDRWDVDGPLNRCLSIWKGITSVKDAFANSIRYRVGSGLKILFWHDKWVGDRPLVDWFPDLFKCARDPEAKVGDYMERGSH